MPPPLPFAHSAYVGVIPDPFAQPYAYEGLVGRRIVAYAIDVTIIAIAAAILWVVLGTATVLSFGLLAPVQAMVIVLLPFAYHILLIAGPHSATWGMRVMGIEVRSIVDGQRPTVLQAILQVVIFYASIALTSSLILLLAFFNPRRRTLHDYAAGTIVLRRPVERS